MSVLVPFTGPLVFTEMTTDLLTNGTSRKMSGFHYGLPMELCASAITSPWQHRTCTVTSDPMTVSESARADQYCSLIGRALRSGDIQDRFLCRVLLDEQWQSWHSGPPGFLQDDDHFGVIKSVYLVIRSCGNDDSACYASLTSRPPGSAAPSSLPGRTTRACCTAKPIFLQDDDHFLQDDDHYTIFGRLILQDGDHSACPALLLRRCW